MFQTLSCSLLFSILLHFGFYAQAATKPEELLAPQEVSGKLTSVNDAVEAMYVASDVLEIPKSLEGKLFAEPDLSLVEIDAIEKVIASKNKKREIIYIRYTNGDMRIVDALIRAKNAGVKVTVITDFNTVMTGKFVNGEKSNTRFNEAEYHKTKDGQLTEGAKAIHTLVDNGFEIGKDLLSQPLYLDTEENRIPIMHIKGMITFVGEKITTWFGTNNASRNPRYNRLLKVVDQAFGVEFLEYLRELAKIFKAEKPLSETAARPPVQINYKDGSFLKISFTQGRFNTNDAQIELLQTAELKEFYASHFAPAYNKLIQAIYENLQTVSPKARGTYVVDDRFGAPDGWGAMIRLSGFNVLMPFGKMLFGIKDTVARRIDGWIYQRPAIDPDTGLIRVERSQDGPPEERHVWHDKSTLYELVNGKAYIFTGSFNLSGNYKNAEVQAEIATTSDSWLTEGFRHSIVDVIQKEKGKWMMTVYEATVRNSIGVMTGHTDLEVPIELAAELVKGLRAKNVEAVDSALRKMIVIQSFLDGKLSPDVIENRIEAFMSYYKWYLQNVGGETAFSDARLRRLTLIPLLLGKPELTNNAKFSIMESVVWRPDLSGNKEGLDKLILEGLGALGLKDVTVPVRKEKPAPEAVVETSKRDSKTQTSGKLRKPRALPPTCKKYFAA